MSKTFADLGLSARACESLAKRGFNSPFAVQEMVIRDVLDGHDVLVQSPTGSGKTLAFGLPVLDRIDPSSGGPSALVLAPTRELASQILDELEPVADALGLSIATVHGGVAFGPQIKRARKADLIVATPGRLEDLLNRGVTDLRGVTRLVLDEADRMLDMGFRPAVDRIVDATSGQRQTLFFSATLEGATGKVARRYTQNARTHTQAPEPEAEGMIDHTFLALDTRDSKIPALIAQLSDPERGRTLVFVRTKRGADRLAKRLGSKNVRVTAIHGNKSQPQRDRALAGFERGEFDTLVATDVAARGIDVEDVTHVINFDIPGDHETYTHRVGRTGRAGRSGTGVSFVTSEERGEMRRMAGALGLGDAYANSVGGPGPSEAGTGQGRPKSSRRRSKQGGGRSGAQGNGSRPSGQGSSDRPTRSGSTTKSYRPRNRR